MEAPIFVAQLERASKVGPHGVKTMRYVHLSASTLEREALALPRIEAAFPLKGWAIALDE